MILYLLSVLFVIHQADTSIQEPVPALEELQSLIFKMHQDNVFLKTDDGLISDDTVLVYVNPRCWNIKDTTFSLPGSDKSIALVTSEFKKKYCMYRFEAVKGILHRQKYFFANSEDEVWIYYYVKFIKRSEYRPSGYAIILRTKENIYIEDYSFGNVPMFRGSE